jgi:hypothetical protein
MPSASLITGKHGKEERKEEKQDKRKEGGRRVKGRKENTKY